MNKPRISWLLLEEHEGEYQYVPRKSYEESDSFSSGDTVIIKGQLWNNIGGAEDVMSIDDVKLVVYFKDYENNMLLNLIEIKKEDNEYEKLEIDLDRGYIYLGSLSGKKNNGSEANKDNHYNIEFKLGPIPKNIKSGIKNLVLDIEYNDNRN